MGADKTIVMDKNKVITFFICVLPFMFVYNNCARIDQSASESVSKSSFVYLDNDGLFPQKALYDSYSRTPLCSEEVGAPVANLFVNYQFEDAEYQFRDCESQEQKFDIFDQVETNGYNPHFVRYRNTLFAQSELHNGIVDHLYYKEFCYNQVEQVDFSIQYIETDSNLSNQPIFRWVGIRMYGPMTENAGIHFNGGYFNELSSDLVEFQSIDKLYKVEIDRSQSITTARLTQRDGKTIEMICWTTD